MANLKTIILSVHFPKTGGTTFKSHLRRCYGKENVILDNELKPLTLTYSESKELIERKNKEKFIPDFEDLLCIHGHFFPASYNFIFNDPMYEVYVITTLRDPLDRAISHYNYWFGSLNEKSHKFHRKVVEENWTFRQFYMSERIQNIYSRFFLFFDIKRINQVIKFGSFNTDLENIEKSKSLPNFKLKKHLHLNRRAHQSTPKNIDILEFKKINNHDYNLYSQILK